MFICLLISLFLEMFIACFVDLLVQNYNKYIVQQNKMQEKYNIYLYFNIVLQIQGIYLHKFTQYNKYIYKRLKSFVI